MPTSKHKRKRKVAPRSRERSKTIAVTIALYDPNRSLATKMGASALHEISRDLHEMKKWFSDVASDVRTIDEVVKELGAFIEKWNPKRIVTVDEIIGCPHEEGIDYPSGEACPACPYWKGRDRFTGEYVH